MTELLHWWNLVFLLPLALAVLLLLVSGLSGLGMDGAEAGDATGEGHAHAEAADASGDDVGDSESPLSEVLRGIGVGVVPLSLLGQTFLLVFGGFGFFCNHALNVAANPASRFWLALLIAVLAGGIVTGLFGMAFKRFMPTDEPATANRDLIGRVGRVIYEVTRTEGTVQVRDASGTLHQVAARVPAGNPLPAGREALLVSHNAETGYFLVEESPFSA